MSNKKELIFTDQEGINYDVKLKKATLQKCEELIRMTNDVGVQISDYTAYFENPIEYTQEKYFEANKDKLPAAISQKKALEFTSFDFNKAKILIEYISKNITNVKITTDGVLISTNEELYKYYLSEEKREYYNDVLNYIEAIKKLSKHAIIRQQHAFSVCNGIKGNFTEIYPDYSLFRSV
jgi:hypothetical protein